MAQTAAKAMIAAALLIAAGPTPGHSQAAQGKGQTGTQGTTGKCNAPGQIKQGASCVPASSGAGGGTTTSDQGGGGAQGTTAGGSTTTGVQGGGSAQGTTGSGSSTTGAEGGTGGTTAGSAGSAASAGTAGGAQNTTGAGSTTAGGPQDTGSSAVGTAGGGAPSGTGYSRPGGGYGYGPASSASGYRPAGNYAPRGVYDPQRGAYPYARGGYPGRYDAWSDRQAGRDFVYPQPRWRYDQRPGWTEYRAWPVQRFARGRDVGWRGVTWRPVGRAGWGWRPEWAAAAAATAATHHDGYNNYGYRDYGYAAAYGPRAYAVAPHDGYAAAPNYCYPYGARYGYRHYDSGYWQPGIRAAAVEAAATPVPAVHTAPASWRRAHLHQRRHEALGSSSADAVRHGPVN